MAQLDWGLLNTNAPMQIAGAFNQGMDAENARQNAAVEQAYLAKKRLAEQAAAEKAITNEQRRQAFLATIPERMRAQIVSPQRPTLQNSGDITGLTSQLAQRLPPQQTQPQLGFEQLGQEMLAIPGLETTGFSMLTEAQKEAARLKQATEEFKLKQAEYALARQDKAEQAQIARTQHGQLLTTLKGMNPQPMNLKEVKDDNSPTGWSYVDARTRQMIPGAPAPASANKQSKSEETLNKGKESLGASLDALKLKYDELNRLEAIPSTQRQGFTNLGSSAGASGVGQFTGKVFGTEAQKLRDEIKSARLMLLQDIKNATGMTASQMNSNVELTNWLNAVTDPSLIYETNTGIIDTIRDKYINQKPASSENPPATAVPQSAPARKTIGGVTYEKRGSQWFAL